MKVQVVYAQPEQQCVVDLELAEGACVVDAVRASGLLEQHQLQLEQHRLGIFGRLAQAQDPLCAGDRVEIYRRLSADPNTLRRQRAAQARQARQR